MLIVFNTVLSMYVINDYIYIYIYIYNYGNNQEENALCSLTTSVW